MQATALAKGLPLSDPGLAALEKQARDQLYTTVASEVTEPAAQQLIRLDRMQGVQDFVGDVGNIVAVSSVPLTSQQGAQLAQILANASVSYHNGGDADPNTINWDIANEQAAALLSGPQFQAFNYEATSLRWHDLLQQFYSRPPASSP